MKKGNLRGEQKVARRRPRKRLKKEKLAPNAS